MKRLVMILAPLLVAGLLYEAKAGGTGGLAIPTGVCASASGEYVGLVGLDVTAGWLHGSPHSVLVRITSNNAVPDEPHGEGMFEIAGLTLNRVIEQGVAEVIIPWCNEQMCLDENSTTLDHVYTVFAQVIYADNRLGNIVEVGGFRFNDCD